MEVLSIADRFRDESRSTHPDDKAYEDKLDEIFSAVIASQDRALADLTFSDLLEACQENVKISPARGAEQDR